MSELNNIALKILSNGKGILAADESNGTMTKRLDSVNVPSNPENRLLFRKALFSSEKMKDCIGGVILFDETTPLNLIKSIKPDILFKGNDYTLKNVVGAKEMNKWGGKVILIPVVQGKSSSKIIQKLS